MRLTTATDWLEVQKKIKQNHKSKQDLLPLILVLSFIKVCLNQIYKKKDFLQNSRVSKEKYKTINILMSAKKAFKCHQLLSWCS